MKSEGRGREAWQVDEEPCEVSGFSIFGDTCVVMWAAANIDRTFRLLLTLKGQLTPQVAEAREAVCDGYARVTGNNE
jgi:hypothetical protein